jgi:prophage antirepressor-like protein
MSNLITINNVRGYIDDNGTAHLNLEDVARGLGFTRVATSGNEVVRWERVDKYLVDMGVPTCGHEGYIPESVFYRLAMKAKNAIAESFQSTVANNILPEIRKTGSYTAKPMSIEDLIIAQATSVKELKAQVTEIAGTVQQLQAAQEKKADITATLPPVNEKSLRANINSIVRSYASRNKYDFRDTFGTLYREFYYRYSIDLKTRARNRNCNAFDVAEADGCLKELLSLAITLFA